MRHHRKPPIQFNLFDPSNLAEPMTMPGWQALPFQTRETLTGLMAHLLLAHDQVSARRQGQDVGEVNDD